MMGTSWDSCLTLSIFTALIQTITRPVHITFGYASGRSVAAWFSGRADRSCTGNQKELKKKVQGAHQGGLLAISTDFAVTCDDFQHLRTGAVACRLIYQPAGGLQGLETY